MILRDTKETFKVVKTELKDGVPKHSVIDLEDISFNGKSVVCLSGNLTKTPEKAVGYSANAYSWLDNHPNRNDVTFYSLYYPTEQPLETNLAPNLALDYRRLSKKLLFSAVRRNNDALPKDEMIDNLSNITFFGHSAGGMVMNEILDYFVVFLKRYSFSKEDIEEVLSSIVFVGYAPFEFVNKPIKTIYITPFYDTLGSARKAIDEISTEKSYNSSNKKLETINNDAINCNNYEEFIDLYKPILEKDKSISFSNNNKLFFMPDLLINDGVIEDHNLAGVTKNQNWELYKTPAGEQTTNFLHNTFKQCIEQDRKNLNMENLLNNEALSNKEPEEGL